MNKNQSLLQKMILISPELLNKWKQMLIDDEQLTETDRKLKNIILNKTMNDSEKWYNYKQVILQNPHKFRYWQNENIQNSIGRSIGTQSDIQENIRSIGTQSDYDYKPIIKPEYRDIVSPKLNQSKEIKVNKSQVILEEIPSNIKIIKAKTTLEKKADARIAESILRKKALAVLERGCGKLKLKKLKKTADNRVVGARYYDDVNNQSISVDLSTDDELQAETESYDIRPERNRKQVGMGVSTRITKLKTYKNKIPWIPYREKV